MNRRGQVQILGIMLWVFAFIVAVVLAPPIKELTTEMRSADNLDCGTEGLSMGVYATCIIVDWYLPYFIATLMIGGATFVTFRRT